ncbi:hypothetical protein KHQ89_01775 [Mycoplasmatota bacterium]|nr:hypothetical protein KHQ89_01775 [Mycoplasmatota bacterium]
MDHYGKEEAYGILESIRLISFGNDYGINYGNFGHRFTKKGRGANSKLVNYLFICISAIILFNVTLLINLFKKKQYV